MIQFIIVNIILGIGLIFFRKKVKELTQKKKKNLIFILSVLYAYTFVLWMKEILEFNLIIELLSGIIITIGLMFLLLKLLVIKDEK